jgi:cation:H+ antiporter
MYQALIIFFLSIVGLLFGAHWTVGSSEKIGRFFGLPSLVIGIVLVGFGTSLPELIVSQLACFHGDYHISLGNLIGSNISNIGLILGVSSFLVPISISETEERKQLIFNGILLALVSFIIFVLKEFSYLSSFLLLLFFVIYFYFTVNSLDLTVSNEDRSKSREKIWPAFLGFLFGLILLYFSGSYLVDSTKDLSSYFGISEYVTSVIGLALGTSAPELFTALIACYRRSDVDLILGNILGSNVFNLSLILGSTGFYSFGLENINLSFEMMILFILIAYLFLMSFFGREIKKRSSLVLLFLYAFCIHSWINA